MLKRYINACMDFKQIKKNTHYSQNILYYLKKETVILLSLNLNEHVSEPQEAQKPVFKKSMYVCTYVYNNMYICICVIDNIAQPAQY